MQKKMTYIAPDAEVLCFRAAQRLAWQDLEGEDGFSTGFDFEEEEEEEEE